MKIRTLFDIEMHELYACLKDIERLLQVDDIKCRKFVFNNLENVNYVDIPTFAMILNKYESRAPAGIVDQLKDAFEL